MHLSLDFWNTLAVYNPAFSAGRLEALSGQMGTPPEETRSHYVTIKREVDRVAEAEGRSCSSTEVFRRTLSRGRRRVTDEIVRRVHDEVQHLALDHPPRFNRGTIDTLMEARRRGVSISVTSNTNFVTGETIREILRRAGVPFAFGLFSDEHGHAKPSPVFFRAMLDRLPAATRVVHLGDHPVCDAEGATRAGIEGRMTTYETLETTLRDLLSHEHDAQPRPGRLADAARPQYRP